jgi:hypothetical protein
MSGEYLLEFVRIGNQVKVTACDPDTGTEAVIFGPSNTTKKALSDLAVRKLHYVLGKNKEQP